MDPGELLTTWGVLAVFVVLLLKETGVPIPVPGDLIMLLAGIRAAEGGLGLGEVLIAILAASLIGASIQFALVRGPGRRFVYRFGRYVGLSAARLDRVAAKLQARGARAVAIVRITPGVRAAAPIAAGLAGLRFAVFFLGIAIGSAIWILFHTLLGYFAGPVVLTWLQSFRVPVLPVAAGVLLFGLGIWFLFGRRRRAGGAPAGPIETLRAWSEAGCPACALAGAFAPDPIDEDPEPALGLSR